MDFVLHFLPESLLWKKLLELDDKHNIKFIWVKGHASNKENNRCDELARAAAAGKNLLIDNSYL